MSGEIETKLRTMGHELPQAPEAVGFYVPVLRAGNFVVTSGQLPFVGGEIVFSGKLGDELHDHDGFNAAQICILNALAQIKACIGDLDLIAQVMRIEGYVHSAPGFQGQPHVLNGASELLVELLGDKGKHTRIALGVNEMPLNAAVQLSLWVAVADRRSSL